MKSHLFYLAPGLLVASVLRFLVTPGPWEVLAIAVCAGLFAGLQLLTSRGEDQTQKVTSALESATKALEASTSTTEALKRLTDKVTAIDNRTSAINRTAPR